MSEASGLEGIAPSALPSPSLSSPRVQPGSPFNGGVNQLLPWEAADGRLTAATEGVVRLDWTVPTTYNNRVPPPLASLAPGNMALYHARRACGVCGSEQNRWVGGICRGHVGTLER